MRHAVLLAGLVLAAPVGAATATDAYRVMGIATKDVLSGTCLAAPVVPGEGEQLTCITTHLATPKDRDGATDVRLDVFRAGPKGLVSLYTRSFGRETKSQAGRGNLQLVDLDGDGRNEIVASWESYADPLVEQEMAEVIVHDRDKGFRTAWTGPLKYDATKSARGVPAERRDRYSRELDIPATLRTNGDTLFLVKRVVAVAGERLAEPQTVRESFPLRGHGAG